MPAALGITGTTTTGLLSQAQLTTANPSRILNTDLMSSMTANQVATNPNIKTSFMSSITHAVIKMLNDDGQNVTSVTIQ